MGTHGLVLLVDLACSLSLELGGNECLRHAQRQNKPGHKHLDTLPDVRINVRELASWITYEVAYPTDRQSEASSACMQPLWSVQGEVRWGLSKSCLDCFLQVPRQHQLNV